MISKRIHVTACGVMAFLILSFAMPSAIAQVPRMYWTFQVSGGCDNSNVNRANLDGSNIELLIPNLCNAGIMKINKDTGKMYWIGGNVTGDVIFWANLDGSAMQVCYEAPGAM